MGRILIEKCLIEVLTALDTGDVREGLRKGLQHLKGHLQAESASLWLYRAGSLKRMVFVGAPPPQSLPRFSAQIPSRLRLWENPPPPWNRLRTREGTLLSVLPMGDRSGTQGLLVLEFRKEQAIPEEALRLCAQAFRLAFRMLELEREGHQRLAEFEALHRIAEAAATAEQMEDFLEGVYRAVRGVIPGEIFFIALYSPETDELRFVLDEERGVRNPPSTLRLSETSGLTAYVIRERKSVLIRDTQRETLPFRPLVTGIAPRSLVAVPVWVEETPRGVISLQSEEPEVFEETHLKILEDLGRGIGVLLTRVTEREKRARSQARIRLLYKLSLKLMSPCPERKVYEEVLREVLEAAKADCGALRMIPHRSSSKARLLATWGYGEVKFPEEVDLPKLVQQLGTSRIPLVIYPSDFRGHPAWRPFLPLLEKLGVAQSIGLPILIRGRFTGYLVAHRKENRPFDPETIRFLRSVANLFSQHFQSVFLMEEVTETRDFLDAIVKGAPDWIVILDREGRIVFTNPSVRLMGYKAEEVLGAHLSAFCKTTHTLFKVLQELQEKGEVRGERVTFYRANGEEALFNLSGRALKGGERLLVSLRDVTQEEKLRQQVFLASKLSSLGEMAAGIAHEINNPLQAVVGFSSYWLEVLPPEEAPELRRDLERIRDAGERAARIVQDLLRFARGLSEQAKEPLDLRDLVQETLALFRTQLKGTDIELKVQMPDKAVITEVAYGQIQQVLFNLLQNAQQALQESPPPHPRIEIRLTEEGEYAQIIVSDNGPGIPEEIRDQIFDPFFTTKPPGKGTGLGLSIAYRIIEEHGGQIWVESEPGEGARFIISLPLRKKERDAKPVAHRTSPGHATGQRTSLRGKTLVVIDDEVFILEYLRRALEKVGAFAKTFSDPLEGYRYLKEGVYDLAFLDLKMPVSGRELYERLKREVPERADRVVFLTGEIVDEDFYAFVQKAGRPVLTKPVTLEKLYTFLEEALGKEGS